MFLYYNANRKDGEAVTKKEVREVRREMRARAQEAAMEQVIAERVQQELAAVAARERPASATPTPQVAEGSASGDVEYL